MVSRPADTSSKSGAMLYAPFAFSYSSRRASTPGTTAPGGKLPRAKSPRSTDPLLPVAVERVPPGVLPREAAAAVGLLAHLLRLGHALDLARLQLLDGDVAVL